MTLKEEQEIHFNEVKHRLRGTKPYDSEQMMQDWDAALAVATVMASEDFEYLESPRHTPVTVKGGITDYRERMLEQFMTRIRAGLELGVEPRFKEEEP